MKTADEIIAHLTPFREVANEQSEEMRVQEVEHFMAMRISFDHGMVNEYCTYTIMRTMARCGVLEGEDIVTYYTTLKNAGAVDGPSLTKVLPSMVFLLRFWRAMEGHRLTEYKNDVETALKAVKSVGGNFIVV